VHDDLDYSRLKRSLEFFVEQYLPANLITHDSHPVQLLESDEQRSMAMARRSLFVAVRDLVEATRGFSIEHVLSADSELERRDAYTLSDLRSRFLEQRDKA
jgi:hypothetical protein